MSVVDKKLESMKTNPKGDWTIQDLQSVARRYYIDYRQPGTSHVTFSHIRGLSLTVPAYKPIKPFISKNLLK